MGASQSSQPPSRHNSSRHGQLLPDNKLAPQKPLPEAASPMKAPTAVLVDSPTVTTSPPPTAPARPIAAPAVAVPIPPRKASVSAANAATGCLGVAQDKDIDLSHRPEESGLEDNEAEEMDEDEMQTKFGITWFEKDEVEDDLRRSELLSIDQLLI
jgi:hypothetical protein